ncbi:MAG: tetratricopeptide repeat protein [Hyphomicrobium sp.]
MIVETGIGALWPSRMTMDRARGGHTAQVSALSLATPRRLARAVVMAFSACGWIVAAHCASGALANPAAADDKQTLNCEQDNMASLALRACSALIASPDVPAETRGRIYAMRAAAWLREEEPAAAIADFTRAIDLDPNNITALRGRARAHTVLTQHAEAARDWSLIIALQSDKEEFYLERGASYLAAGKTAEAMADYTTATTIDPKSRKAYVGRAKVYDALDEREKAMKEFERALAIDPESFETYLAKAEVADRWGDTKLAIENYSLVLKYNGVYWHARLALRRLGVATPP